MFTIEKNIPMTKSKTTFVGALRALEIGDSFLCAESKRYSVYQVAHGVGIKVSVRKVPGTDQVRIWRIA